MCVRRPRINWKMAEQSLSKSLGGVTKEENDGGANYQKELEGERAREGFARQFDAVGQVFAFFALRTF